MQPRLAVLAIIVLMASSCSSSDVSPAPEASGSTVPTPSSSPPDGSPSASPPTTPPGDAWVSAGAMALGRGSPHVVALGNGQVLVVGNDDPGCVRDDTVLAEVWSPGSNEWTAAPGLGKPRAAFSAVALADGRGLVVGGINAGDRWQANNQSFSSAYVYDATEGWSKTGLLHAARGMATAVRLHDGRVLVLGGVYMGGLGDASGVVLAGYTAGVDERGGRGSQPGDVDPGPVSPALASAELYDPATGAWERTGDLRYARLAPAAVTLADGRVLVVGSKQQSGWGIVSTDDRATTTAEIYDPATGRFSLLGKLPEIDWSPIADVGPVESYDLFVVDPIGVLAVLPDGGALYVDRPTDWSSVAGRIEGRILRTLRFEPASRSWTVLDQHVYRRPELPSGPMLEATAGWSRAEPLVASLADGRVLIAGGIDGATLEPTRAAGLYDPEGDRWTDLPPMPGPRIGGAAVALDDGSVMLVGGRDVGEGGQYDMYDCGEGDTGIDTAVRFVPGG